MRNILLQGAQRLGLEMTDDEISLFVRYYQILEEKNKVMNLTAISGEKDVAELHFLDSLAILTLEDFGGKAVIDIGSGAGFPGLPMKIVEKTINLTLLDAQQKRVSFLEELCGALELDDVRCVHARAEDEALKQGFRDSYDAAVSRAVARLNVLSEICLPFVNTGGLFIAMKSTDSDEEIKEAENSFKCMGAGLERVFDYKIPGTAVIHRAVVIRKKTETPIGYPRRFAKIEKKPL